MKITKILFWLALVIILASCTDNYLLTDNDTYYENLPDQFPNNHEKGWIRVKFTELENDLNTNTTRSGGFDTGIKEVDEVATLLGATHIERLFGEGGKFSERRQKYGMHLWYDFYVGEEQSVTRSIRTFKDLPMVEHVDLIPVDHQTSYGNNSFSNFAQATLAAQNSNIERPNAGNGNNFNDPYLNRQWHYFNDGTSHPKAVSGADANIFEAWEFTTGHPDVIVAIMDGGIDVNHPDLKQNLWINKGEVAGNGVDDDNNGYTDDIHGWKWGRSSIGAVASGDIFPMDHGSHCAGTVAAVNNNGVGLAGVAGGNGSGNSGVRLMSCQTYVPDFEGHPEDPHGNSRSTSQTPDAFAYAADNGAVIVNCSFSYGNPGTLKEEYRIGIEYFVDNAGIDENGVQTGPMKGGLIVGSAGNDGEEDLVKYPASHKDAINVAYSMSDYKKSPSSNYGHMIDVTAPGGASSTSYDPERRGGIFSTIAMDSRNSHVEKGYMYKSGTSMAAPHVTGIAALILSAAIENNIPMTHSKLKEIILASCWDLDEYNPEYAGKLGRGQVDAATGIKLLIAGDDYFTDEPQNVTLVESLNSIEVNWTVPGDYFEEAVREIEVFYSLSKVDGIDLDSQPLPGGVRKEVTKNNKNIGETDSRVISNLSPDTQVYFALRSIDKQGRKSDPVFISGKTKSNEGGGGTPDPEKPDPEKPVPGPSGQFKVYPTTVKDSFSVTSPKDADGKANITVFSATGYKVVEKEFNTSTVTTTVGVKDLSTGAYTVQIEYAGHKENHKIIKY